MRIGFIVDGDAEFGSLPRLLSKVDTREELLGRVVKASVHPLGGIGKLVRGLMHSVRVLVLQRKVDLAVVLLDREQRPDCCGALATELKDALVAECAREGLAVQIEVVFKDRMFENWLIADLDALRSCPKRFRVAPSTVKAVEPNRADTANALQILKTATQQGGYDKVGDAKLILSAAEPLRIAANSRSFRRLLRVVGSPRYAKQSRRP